MKATALLLLICGLLVVPPQHTCRADVTQRLHRYLYLKITEAYLVAAKLAEECGSKTEEVTHLRQAKLFAEWLYEDDRRKSGS